MHAIILSDSHPRTLERKSEIYIRYNYVISGYLLFVKCQHLYFIRLPLNKDENKCVINIQYDVGKSPRYPNGWVLHTKTFLLSIIVSPLSNRPGILLKRYLNRSKKPVRDHLTELALVFTGTLWNDTFLRKAKHDLLPQNTVLGSARTNYGTKRSPRAGPLCRRVVLNALSLWAALWGLNGSTEPWHQGRLSAWTWSSPSEAVTPACLFFSFSPRAADPCSLAVSAFLGKLLNLLWKGVFVIELRHSQPQRSWGLCHAACHIMELFQGRLGGGSGRGWPKNALVSCQKSCVSHLRRSRV